jgi:quercetin dioxygenase-like cupin family protein
VVVKGRIRILTEGGEELVRAGDAYYMAPGHNVVVDEDCELVEFSPVEERRVTLEHFEKSAAALTGA